jgi:hypothetical protein
MHNTDIQELLRTISRLKEDIQRFTSQGRYDEDKLFKMKEKLRLLEDIVAGMRSLENGEGKTTEQVRRSLERTRLGRKQTGWTEKK